MVRKGKTKAEIDAMKDAICEYHEWHGDKVLSIRQMKGCDSMKYRGDFLVHLKDERGNTGYLCDRVAFGTVTEEWEELLTREEAIKAYSDLIAREEEAEKQACQQCHEEACHQYHNVWEEDEKEW